MSFTLNPFTGKFDYFESGGAVSSVTASDSTIIVSPTTGAVLVAVNEAHAFNWGAAHSWGGAITIDPSSSIQLNVNSNFTVDDGGVMTTPTIYTAAIYSTIGFGTLELGAAETRLADDSGVGLDGGTLTFRCLGTNYFYHNGTFAAWDCAVAVPDDAYGAGWDGNLEVPTKNALYDKIQTISGGGGPSIGDIATISASTTLNSTYYTVLCNCTSGAITVTLPAAASNDGRVYNIKKIDSSANVVTIDANGSETIDDDTTLVIESQYTSVEIQSDGVSEWVVV